MKRYPSKFTKTRHEKRNASVLKTTKEFDKQRPGVASAKFTTHELTGKKAKLLHSKHVRSLKDSVGRVTVKTYEFKEGKPYTKTVLFVDPNTRVVEKKVYDLLKIRELEAKGLERVPEQPFSKKKRVAASDESALILAKRWG